MISYEPRQSGRGEFCKLNVDRFHDDFQSIDSLRRGHPHVQVQLWPNMTWSKSLAKTPSTRGSLGPMFFKFQETTDFE
jgi:hypothetical protein